MQSLTIGLAISDEDLRQEVRACVRTLGVRVLMEQARPAETLQLRHWGLDLLLIDATSLEEPIEDQVRRAKLASPGTMVGVVHRSLDPEMILRAMRAGADEFIPSPVGERLRAALDRMGAILAKRRMTSRQMGKVVGFVSAKGGCGATSVACHVAEELQRLNQKDVLLADLDLESGMTAFLMGATSEYSILDALKNVGRLDHSLWKGFVSSCGPRLDVIPAPAGLAISDAWDLTKVHDVFRLIRSMYGWVLADLGRTLNPIALTLLEELDEVHLVTTPAMPALFQAKRFIQRALDAGYPRHQIRLVLNRVPRRNDLVSDDLQEVLGLPIAAELPERGELDEAYASGKLLRSNTDLGRRIAGLAWKIAGAQEVKSRGWTAWFQKGDRRNYTVRPMPETSLVPADRLRLTSY
jgi:pilus assembly protein CpaE